MLDKKKIEEAAKVYFNKNIDKWFDNGSFIQTSDAESIAYPNFKAGANWALKEFLKNLWHDALEEPNPNLNAWIIMQTDKDSWCIVKYGGYNKDGGQTWQCEAEKGHVLRWCYLSDILPQEEKGGSDV